MVAIDPPVTATVATMSTPPHDSRFSSSVPSSARAAQTTPPRATQEELASWITSARAAAARRLRRRFGSRSFGGLDVEDVLGEATVVALQSSERLRQRSEAGFRAWFHGVCARRAIDLMRRHGRGSLLGTDALERREGDPLAELCSPAPRPESRLARRERRRARTRALATLERSERALIVLRDLLSIEWAGIARLGGWSSADAARKAHERARRRLERSEAVRLA